MPAPAPAQGQPPMTGASVSQQQAAFDADRRARMVALFDQYRQMQQPQPATTHPEKKGKSDKYGWDGKQPLTQLGSLYSGDGGRAAPPPMAPPGVRGQQPPVNPYLLQLLAASRGMPAMPGRPPMPPPGGMAPVQQGGGLGLDGVEGEPGVRGYPV